MTGSPLQGTHTRDALRGAHGANHGKDKAPFQRLPYPPAPEPVRELLVLDTEKERDQKTLQELAKRIKCEGFCDGMDAMEVYTKLDRVRKIRDKDVVVITIGHELEDVVEVFSRLNSRGTRVTEADIYLGVVAARNPGWVRETFLPSLNVLGDAGFRIDPNLLFRTVTGVGIKKVRFREIPDNFWEAAKIRPAWERSWDAWKRLVARFREFGVLSSDPMPTEAALVPLVTMIDKYGDDGAFSSAFFWFLQASRFGRYSGSGTTSLEEDLRDIDAMPSIQDATRRLLSRFPHGEHSPKTIFSEITATQGLVDFCYTSWSIGMRPRTGTRKVIELALMV